MTIELDKISMSGADPEVIEVYRLLKRYKEDTDRTWWETEVYKRCWEVAWGKSESLWTEEEKKAMTDKGQIPISINDLSKGIQGASSVVTANRPGINVSPVGIGDLYIAEILKRGFDFVWAQNVGNFVVYDAVKEAKTGSIGWFDVRFDPTKGKHGKIVFESDNPLDYYWDKKSRKHDKSDTHIIKAHLITPTYAKETYGVTDDDLSFRPLPTDDQEGKSSAGKPGEDEYARMKEEKQKDTPPGSTNPDDIANVWEIEAWLIKQKETAELAIIDKEGRIERFFAQSEEQIKNAIELLPEGHTHKVIKRKVEVREQRVIVGKKLISTEINPFGADSDGDPVLPKIPLIHDRAANGMCVSPTYRAIEITRSRNKRRMQTIYVISKNIDAPIVRPEGTKWVKDPVHGDELVVDRNAAFPPARLLPGTTSAELVAMEQRDEAALNEEYDMHDVMKGKLPPGVDSGRLVLALQDQAGMMSGPFIGAVERAIEQLAKAILALMLRHWTWEMWDRLIEQDELAEWQPEKQKQPAPVVNGPEMDAVPAPGATEGTPPPPVVPEQVLQDPTFMAWTDAIHQDPKAERKLKRWHDALQATEGDPGKLKILKKWANAIEMIRPIDSTKEPGFELDGLDIRIVAGSTMPTNRMAKQSVAIEMVKGGIYDPQAALDYIDDPKKDEIVARMKAKDDEVMKAVAMGEQMKGAK